MGFWHTGYIEFHEPIGFSDYEWRPLVEVYSCPHCGKAFQTADDVRRHRFEVHPLRRPAMFLDGLELGNRRVRVNRRLGAASVKVENATTATLNGRDIAVRNLGRELAAVSNDVCQILLRKDRVEARFEIEVRVAEDADLRGVEDQFERMVAANRLDIRAIEEFISSASRFKSASGYCDGICSYLYAILAKERDPETSIPYEEYIRRFARAAEDLGGYDRGLARVIGGNIGFHFNHFRDTQRLCRGSRLGQVAGYYGDWLEGRITTQTRTDCAATRLDSLVTDWETEQILRWASQAPANLAQKVEDIELFLKRDLGNTDRVKLHILLGEIHAACGNRASAIDYAKALRNDPVTEAWAEALIRQVGANP